MTSESINLHLPTKISKQILFDVLKDKANNKDLTENDVLVLKKNKIIEILTDYFESENLIKSQTDESSKTDITSSKSNLIRLKDLKRLALEENSILENNENAITYFDIPRKNLCPFASLETNLPNNLSSKLFIVTGLPSVGKTTFLYDWATYFSRKSNDSFSCASVLFSLEMTTFDLIDRHSDIGDNFYIIENTLDFKLKKIEQIIKQLTAEYGCLFVGIDYLHLIPDAMNSDTEAVRISKIVTKLKLFAKEYGCLIVAISDVAKSSSYNFTKGKIQGIDIVKDSFTIAYSADLMLYLANIEHSLANVGLKIIKNRYGKKDVYIPFELAASIDGKLSFIEKSKVKNVEYSF